MIITILKIRLLQLFRLVKEIGLFRIIILLLITGLVVYMVFNFLMEPENTGKSLIAVGLLILSLHASRNDKHFIKTIMIRPYSIYLSEYFLLTLPLFVIWIIYFNWIGIALLLSIVLLIPLIPINFKLRYLGSIIKLLINPVNSNFNSKFKVRLPLISSICFEWISGIRRNLILLLPIYLFLLAFSFKPYVAVIGMILLSILISGFYYYGEPREYVEFFANNPREFIRRKIFINLKQLIILFTPILLIAITFQTNTWYYLIGAIIISFLIQVLTIIFKYGLFEENANLNRNSMIVFINILFVVIPVFLPVPIIMGIMYYKKAHQNLKKYLHD